MINNKSIDIRTNRLSFIKSIGLNVIDLDIWINKWRALCKNSKQYNSKCLLSFEEYVNLAIEANIYDPNSIGCRIDDYQMGRFGDKGYYEIGNCRFITRKQNLEEMKINGGITAMANALKGRTKENHLGVASMAAKASMRGISPITVKKLSRNYLLISPDGEKFEGSNVSQFCRENNLCQVSICNVCRGAQKSYKGWTGYYKEK